MFTKLNDNCLKSKTRKELRSFLTKVSGQTTIFLNRWNVNEELNFYMKFLKSKGEVVLCKKCRFPYLRFGLRCKNCGYLDEEEWKKVNSETLEGLDYVIEEDPFEKAAEALLILSGVMKKIPPGKKVSDFCVSCGAAKQGSKCRYCGTQF